MKRLLLLLLASVLVLGACNFDTDKKTNNKDMSEKKDSNKHDKNKSTNQSEPKTEQHQVNTQKNNEQSQNSQNDNDQNQTEDIQQNTPTQSDNTQQMMTEQEAENSLIGQVSSPNSIEKPEFMGKIKEDDKSYTFRVKYYIIGKDPVLPVDYKIDKYSGEILDKQAEVGTDKQQRFYDAIQEYKDEVYNQQPIYENDKEEQNKSENKTKDGDPDMTDEEYIKQTQKNGVAPEACGYGIGKDKEYCQKMAKKAQEQQNDENQKQPPKETEQERQENNENSVSK
ncbi:hypothetical protein [Staphylococcus caeli]|uniref:Lipoprotein n=1 Tax=Staphylococcus caeli TaxID=2201815 RepID=A0A1D4RG63_9STAP|nr:hypothetical protein [Staphylococcus caeli]SCT42865.1 putative lipoprotein [Staphylococcus caeli]SCT46282.1 putative lipoprotein [Staphylococcus caeli]